MDGSRRALERQIASRPEEAEELCREIRAWLSGQGLDGACFCVELLARECLVNAIVHGNGNDPRKTVRLLLTLGRKWIRLEVSDQGAGFDWRRARRGALPEASDPRGRGLRIGAHYAARMAFNREGNRITLWLPRQSAAGVLEHGGLHH